MDCFGRASQLRFKFILKVDKNTEKEIVKLVDMVIKGKKENIDTREFEEEIDRVVWLKPAVGVGCMV